MIKKISLSFYLLLLCFYIKSQNNSLIFSNDSLFGFDFNSIRILADARGIDSSEFNFFFESQKREFIRNKYNLKSEIDFNEKWYSSNLSKIAVSYCQNEDFENSVSSSTLIPSLDTIKTINGLNGWMSLSGINSGSVNSCVLSTACCTNNPSGIVLIKHDTLGYFDALIGNSYRIFSVFGDSLNKGNVYNPFVCKGNSIVKLNNQQAGAGINRLAKSFTVTPSNSLFTFAYMVIAQGGHCCCDNNGVAVKIKDCSGNLLPCPQFSMAPSQQSSSLCPGYIPCLSSGSSVTMYNSTSPAFIYSRWKISAVDLTPFIGSCVTIEMNAFDCPYSGHAGYGYFDAQCDSMHIKWNSKRISAVTNTINLKSGSNNITNIASCAAVTDTLEAPIGLEPYIWTGPLGFTTATTRSITTNIAGIYTLSIGGFGSFTPTYKYINLTHSIVPIPVVSSNSIICSGDSVSLFASGVNTYTWSTGSNSPSIVVTPSITTTYTVLGTTQFGCPASAIYTQSVAVCTGINATTKYLNDFIVTPNPSNGEFVIKNANYTDNLKVEIINTFGQMVLKESIHTENTVIKLNNVSDGIYFIQLNKDGKLLYATKIIKISN